MAFENTHIENQAVEPAAPLPGEQPNRTYRMAAAVLGVITLLALAGILVFTTVFLPQKRSQREQQIQALVQQNTQVALAITQTSAVLSAAATTSAPSTAAVTEPPVTSTPAASPTSVILLPTATRAPTRDARTATVAALFTQAAHVTGTVAPTPTALPETGIADRTGLPAWLGLAALFMGLVFLARQLRTGS